MAIAADWRAAALIASIRRRGNVSMSNEGWNETDFLAAINEELRSYVVPLIRRINEDYLVAYVDTTTTTATRYRIPEAAMGESLKDVGKVVNGEFQALERINSGSRSVVGGYYLENEDVVLHPAPNSGETLRMKYVRRPSKVIGDLSRTVQVAALGGTAYVTVGSYALDNETTVEAWDNAKGQGGTSSLFDITSARPGFRTSGEALVGVYDINLARVTWTPASTYVPEVGDYLNYSGESPVPQIPAESHPLLAQAVLCQYLKATDRAAADDRRKEMEGDLIALLTPRTENQPHRFVNPHSPGWGGNWGRRIGQD